MITDSNVSCRGRFRPSCSTIVVVKTNVLIHNRYSCITKTCPLLTNSDSLIYIMIAH